MNPITYSFETADWISLLLFLSLLILAFGRYYFPYRFKNFLALPMNNKYLAFYNHPGKLSNWFHILITTFQLINITLFLYLFKNILALEEATVTITFYFILLVLFFLFLTLKGALQLGNSFVFSIEEVVSELIFFKTTYFNYSSLAIFLGNVILIYIINGSKTVIYATLIVVALINIIGFITILRYHQKFITANILYFILYLCTLEIAPLVIIGSYLKV